MSEPLRCIVLGAGGRDFHDIQTFFRAHPEFRVLAITAAQIPFIERRTFPRELAGPAYDADIPIFPEQELAALIARYAADLVFLAYSDLAHEEVMHKASLAQACGAGFAMLGPRLTQLRSRLPVVAVTAVRTGAGKSPLTQALARWLAAHNRRVAVIRHPMPYGDLRQQASMKFSVPADLDRHGCTIEEREEYEPYIEAGLAVFSGVDYRAVLAEAEKDAEVVLWDGGNNDYPFLRPDLLIVILDALRPGHETRYYPGETNLRAADVVVVNKVSHADPEGLALIRRHVAELNPGAALIDADLLVNLEPGEALSGKRVVVVEDGPSLTHGGAAYGAGTIAARAAGARIVDPRGFAVGTIAQAYAQYPHMGAVLPALGYSPAQRAELEETLRRAPADAIVDASPARLDRVLKLSVPIVRVRYRFEQKSGPSIFELVEDAVARGKR
ncbi:MAG: GTPase [Candidatus Binataceae bacterium]